MPNLFRTNLSFSTKLKKFSSNKTKGVLAGTVSFQGCTRRHRVLPRVYSQAPCPSKGVLAGTVSFQGCTRRHRALPVTLMRQSLMRVYHLVRRTHICHTHYNLTVPCSRAGVESSTRGSVYLHHACRFFVFNKSDISVHN